MKAGVVQARRTGGDFHDTSFSYDPRGLQTLMVNPVGNRTSSSYDAVGNLVSMIDGRGHLLTYSYDSLDRLRSIQYPDNSRATYSYDVVGQLLSISEANGITTSTYEARGLLRSISRPLVGTLTYSYDANGNRTLMIDPDGGWTNTIYDDNDHPQYVTNPFGEQTQLGWNTVDRNTYDNFLSGTGPAQERSYRLDGSLLWSRLKKNSGTLMTMYSAVYDNGGNRTRMTDLDGTRTTYSYDATDQLTREWRGGANAYDITYSYDGMGNRLVQNSSGQRTSYTYDLFNRLTTVLHSDGSLTTYSYDGAGNRTLEQTGSDITTYTWDYENRLSAVANPDGSSESYLYLLDGPRDIASGMNKGLRFKKVSGGTTTYFLWDGMNLLQEKDGSGVTQAHYTGRPDTMRSLLTMRRGSDTRIPGLDVQDSVRLLVDSTQATTDSYLNTALGTQLSSSGTFINPFLYEGSWGYYSDAGSRMYIRARYYSPGIGRWYSVDPIGFQSRSINFYRYVRNNPVRWVDALGHDITDTFFDPPIPVFLDLIQELYYQNTQHVEERHLVEWRQFASQVPTIAGHNWIELKYGCGDSYSFGFWPGSLLGVGEIRTPDPHGTSGPGQPSQPLTYYVGYSDDPDFAAGICECIQSYQLKLGAHDPIDLSSYWTLLGHNCGDWVAQMFACAQRRAAQKKASNLLLDNSGWYTAIEDSIRKLYGVLGGWR